MATPYETYVNLELPRRPVMLTEAITTYDGVPSDVGAPAMVLLAPKGSFFLQTTGSVLWIKNSSTSGDWSTVGSASGFVDLTTNQTIGGEKTFVDAISLLAGDSSTLLPSISTPSSTAIGVETVDLGIMTGDGFPGGNISTFGGDFFAYLGAGGNGDGGMGGRGGSIDFTGGFGGDASPTGGFAGGGGGQGGSCSFASGIGGYATVGGDAGAGGPVIFWGGFGGNGFSPHLPGAGGLLQFQAGSGGHADGPEPGGDGGEILFLSGDAGDTVGGPTTASAGLITFDTGVPHATGSANINIGTTNAKTLNIGRTGQDVAFPGSINLTQAFKPNNSAGTVGQFLKSGGAGTFPVWQTVETPTTTAAMTLYVATTGNDSNPGTIGSPFLTIQACINSIPKRIRHLVTIIVGAGNFTGFIEQGFNVDPLESDNGIPCGIDIQGTLVTFTPATGTATGTATSTTSSNTAQTTLVDAGQTWTIDDLKGKLLEITAGSGVTGLHPIVSNTATDITVPTIGSTPFSGTSQYAIRDWGTIIDTRISIINQIPSVGITATPAETAGVYFSNNRSSRTLGRCFLIQRLKIAPAAPAYYSLFISSIASPNMVNCNISQISGGGIYAVYSADLAGIKLSASVVNQTSGYNAIYTSPGYGYNYLYNCAIFANSSYAVALRSNDFYDYMLNVHIGCTAGAGVSMVTGRVYIQSVLIAGATTGMIVAHPAAAYVSGKLLISGATVQAIKVDTLASLISAGQIYGTGNLVGLNMLKGARAQLASTVTLTGTTEISMDETATTLATMRAASPKILETALGTTIFE